MIYNKPRDIKLRALPSLSSLVGNANTRLKKGKSTDNSINNLPAVPQSKNGTAGSVIPNSKKTIFAGKNKATNNEDKDFDIILKPQNNDNDIFDLTTMPVIEGIPMLVLPEDKPQPPVKTEPETKVIPQTQKTVSAPVKSQTVKSEAATEVVDLTDIPDIEGIPLLPLKPLDKYEDIQPLQDFQYAPPKAVDKKDDTPPRPIFDDEPTATESKNKQLLLEERAEKERIAREKAEKEEALRKAEEQRLLEEKAEKERIAREKAEKEEALRKAEEQRLLEEKAEKERIALEKAEKEEALRKEKEQRLLEEKAEKERIAREKAEKEEALRKEKEQKLLEEKAEKERIAREKAEKKEALKKEKKEKALLEAQRKQAEKEKLDKKRKAEKEKNRNSKSAERKIKAEKRARKKERAKQIFARKFTVYSKIPRTRKLKITSFFVMLYVGTALAFIIPLRPTYSETEKRNLSKFPEFTADAFISGDYFADISTWFSDTFPFREQLTRLNTEIKACYGFDSVVVHGDVEAGDEIPDAPLEIEELPVEETQPVTMPDDDELSLDNGDPNAERPDIEVQSMSAIVVAGNSAYEYYSFAQDIAPRLISCVSDIDGIVKPKGNVYAMIAPTSMDITLNDAIRSEVSSANQEKALNYFNASFKNTVAVDGIYQAERDHRNEYIYFRTDHHWTARGAYYAYEQFTIEKGIDAVPLEDYKKQKFNNFIGTFYSSSGQNPALREKPDYVTAFLPFNDVSCNITPYIGAEPFEWDIINDVSDYDAGGKYLTFIGGDNALTTIVNNDIEKGETCIVIKESYGNAFVPFLIPHYKKIYVIDPRHYAGTLSDFCDRKKIDDVIFICNISATRNYVFLEGLENLIQ